MYTVISFAGIGIIALIDKFVPSCRESHEINRLKIPKNEGQRLMRLGVSALAIKAHNFPEGMATFMAMQDPALGISIALQ